MLTRRTLLSAALAASAALTMSACGAGSSNGGAADPGKPLTVIADAEPHTSLLKEVEKQGLLGDVKIQVREIAGGVDPNQLVQAGDVDANFFQHTPYLKDWNGAHNADLVSVAGVHIEPLGLYSKKVGKTAEIAAGANIAIPADATNQGRALFLLADAGLLTLNVKPTDKDLNFAQVTPKAITGNPKNLTFTTIERPQLFAALADPKIAAAVVNGNYALEGGLVPSKDALYLEKAQDNPYVNILVTTKDKQGDPRVKKLADALRDPKIKSFIESTYSGSVLPAAN